MVISVPRVYHTALAVPVLCVFGEVEVAGEDGGLFVVGWDLLRKLGNGLGPVLLAIAARLEVGVDHVEVAHGGMPEVDPHQSSLNYVVNVFDENRVEVFQELVANERDDSRALPGIV